MTDDEFEEDGGLHLVIIVRDLVPAGYVDYSTRAAILNAAYFKVFYISVKNISDHGEQGLNYVLTGGLVEPVQGGRDGAGELLCEAGPDPDGEVHEPGGRLQLLHQRGAAGSRGGASLSGGLNVLKNMS